MQKLYSLENSEINKKYDLCIFTYKELKKKIIEDSGMTERELQLNFDSEAYVELEKDTEFSLKEIEETERKEWKKKYFEERESCIQKNFRYAVNKISEYTSSRYKDSKYYIEMVTKYTKDLNRYGENLTESLYVEKAMKDSNYFKEIDIDKYPLNINSFDFKKSFEEQYKKSKLYSFPAITEEGKSLKNKKQNKEKHEEGYEKYSTERNKQAIKGIESYNFVIEKTDNRYVLLDGFNRLFGNKYNNDDKELIVKVYHNLTEEEYSIVLKELNDWKIKKGKLGNLFLDRGVRASLFIKYGINVVIDKETITSLNIKKGKNIPEIVREVNKLKEYTKDFSDNLKKACYYLYNGTVLDVNEDVRADEIIKILESKKFQKDIPKIEKYTMEAGLSKYINKQYIEAQKKYTGFSGINLKDKLNMENRI